jgi:hypothetical protein
MNTTGGLTDVTTHHISQVGIATHGAAMKIEETAQEFLMADVKVLVLTVASWDILRVTAEHLARHATSGNDVSPSRMLPQPERTRMSPSHGKCQRVWSTASMMRFPTSR